MQGLPWEGGQGKGWGMGWSWSEKLMAVLIDFVGGRGDNFFLLFMIWENVWAGLFESQLTLTQG